MKPLATSLDPRTQDILRKLIDAYLDTGEPVGSQTLSKMLASNLSPATIRNIMADLEESGLLFSPHVSSGRMPTGAGLRFFVDTLLEYRPLSVDERKAIESHSRDNQRNAPQMLDRTTRALSGLAGCTGFVLTPSISPTIKHIEFVPFGTNRALVVLVDKEDQIENRLIDLPLGITPSTLVSATNYLMAHTIGKSLESIRESLHAQMQADQLELDRLTSRVIDLGLAAWGPQQHQLIVRGQSLLLNEVRVVQDIERIQKLFSILEQQETVIRLLEIAQNESGVKIFIGSEHELFSGTGCAMVISGLSNLHRDSNTTLAGAVGVIGPTRLNYGRIIPLVDYTATVIASMLR